ncbi:serine hydrolase domain-containing protein [Corynebacterium timonense]|uniref:CubicO group peptidase, beta-lactamase class C family n=1 Tax=Corynebacterium timonense TaxID=441500 RepID=A0A1H1M986_9CORY|nr:serine hydrolase domain-containing protein [Corynebacterium timonense]SDR83220.1 CubicO group peptidase, beta-lactamase class C family [Corynebacterium timonense]
MDLTPYLESWPADNVSAALVGRTEASYGDESRVYELASVTKLLSTYAVLLAVEEGAFSLDDALGPRPSTIRHLLAHTSGIGFDTREPQKPVGERRIYSSAGFEMLAEHLEQEAGMAFGDYVREGVFEPLGMGTAEIYGSAGHGGRASLSDMRAFAAELVHPRLLAEETLREAMSPQFGDVRGVVPGYGMQKPCPWGLGFEIRGSKEPHWTGENMPAETAGHFGMAGAFVWVVPAWVDGPRAGTAMVVLTDRDFGEWAKPLWQETNTALFDAL